VAAAAELVGLAIEAAKAAGATGVSVDFTLPDLVDTLADKAFPLDTDRIEAVRRELDAKDAGGLKAAGGEAYLPLLYATGPFAEAIEKLAAIDAGGVLASRIAGLQEIAARVGDAARLTLDPSERHGFEYQSWFGFTLYAEGARGALGRGGTYVIKGSEEAAKQNQYSALSQIRRWLEANGIPLGRQPTPTAPNSGDRDGATAAGLETWIGASGADDTAAGAGDVRP